ncbi:hypothetical protein 2016DhaA_0820 [Vibrio phage ICP1]|uniref:Uncharacterized protein ORF170 n=1 Tax=Vibrio phage ICP1 TaxID=979525 RepID=F1D1J3_9CAUD|nr:deoxynucleoside monophosphate kinase [Vibrio phage ICP1]ADX88212.1 hypothetical protein TUST1-191_00830 [Vibrio phage ICP1_2006_D]ADX88439.1 hypothetical protein TUST1-182_00830 [Vibrio phage ICP1_2006_C]ADX88664.1 hypothetical protein TUST1-159_00820 [Vibrio phage ICP1_2006_B]ADX88890.1 hypothetical protein TUST1-17_00820 [Vibrio phage ICP1_2006_A]ADX89120.1 hypothetical protein TUST1-15_00840 [Vibrio phage ICP1_2005_A]ADX89350.1 hypothetical protein TUST1-2_00850 [Vibrio phage ICP1_2001_
MMNKKAIFISAQQPRSGKDLSAKYLQSFFTDLGYNCEIHAFKDKLIQVACDILNISVDEFLDGYDETSEDYLSRFTKQEQLTRFDIVTLLNSVQNKWWKDVRLYNVNGRFYSKREWIIHVSENIFKPHCGKDYFGQAAANHIDNQDIILYSDSGFAHEAFPVIEKVGKDNCLVVQLIREGYNSGIKDSRKLLEPEDFPEHLRPQFVQVSNPNCPEWQEVLERKLRLKVANKVLEGM